MTGDRILKITKINPLLLLLMVVVVIMALYWIAKGLFKIFALLTPVFFIGAILLNYKVVLGYGKWLIASVKRNPAFGIAAIILSVLGSSFVAAFLFFRALSTRNISSGKKIGEYVNYETVEEDFLDLSDVKEQGKKMNTDYNDVF